MIEVKGNGNVVTREIPVSSFIRLHLSAKGLIELIQSDEEKVVVEADENLQDYFEAVNAGRTLYVTSEAKFRLPVFTKCVIRVYLRQIDMLYVRCDKGDVTCAGTLAFTEPLEIKIQSIGNTELNIDAPAVKVLSQCQGNVVLKGRCGSITIKNQNEGDFSSRDLLAGELTMKNMSVGNIELYADRKISISHYGEGYVHYYGDAALKDVKQYGNGQIRHMK
ncbi:MAG TPA: DUF2807 domain-containing protein [Bacteroidia bacterium]|nr:DUF2807 domain-containing protein [Bacteroidia bacterium]